MKVDEYMEQAIALLTRITAVLEEGHAAKLEALKGLTESQAKLDVVLTKQEEALAEETVAGLVARIDKKAVAAIKKTARKKRPALAVLTDLVAVAPAPSPTAEEGAPSLDEVQRVMREFAVKNGVPALTELIASYGATKASQVPQEKWPELLAKCQPSTTESGGLFD